LPRRVVRALVTAQRLAILEGFATCRTAKLFDARLMHEPHVTLARLRTGQDVRAQRARKTFSLVDNIRVVGQL
jgi:hypothetical protein